MNNYLKILKIILVLLLFISCKKMIDIGAPKTQLSPVEAFSNDQSAVAVISTIYYQFNSLISSNTNSLLSLYTDELITTSTSISNLEYSNGMVSVTNTSNLSIWRSFYSVIYQCNSLLENIEISSELNPGTIQQLKAEALFLRSLSYFYLVNIYGDVPLITTTEVNITSKSSREPVYLIYSKIVNDLLETKKTISDSYPSLEKVRANKTSVTALLAKVYLYLRNWEMAESESSEILSSGNYNLSDNLNEVFLKNSDESILQFWTQQGFTTIGPLFVPTSGAVPSYQISNSLINSFEPNDNRRINWIGTVIRSSGTYFYVNKYKNRSSVTGAKEEYLSILRLSEQYLIRTEARAEQNKINEALDDLNVIRNRAGLLNITTNNRAALLSAIEKERQVELFCEWGSRFFDLRRYGHLDQILSSLKPNWKETSSLLPIPQYERLNNPNLTQNPGY